MKKTGTQAIVAAVPNCSRILIANRGEIAIRIERAAADLGLAAVAVYASDDAASLHALRARESVALQGSGARAYLDIDAIIAAARASGCDAVHPGYGFLSENAAFAQACQAAGLTFIGPPPQVLDVFGDKSRARDLALSQSVAVLPGTHGPASLGTIQRFFAELPADCGMVIKALGGGGGRGLRVVRAAHEIEPAFAACTREALAAFGDGGVYAERLIANARHVEVQIAGDGTRVIALGDRDCSLQRRHQKIVEIAPAPELPAALREALHAAAVRLAAAVSYRSLGTMEFLVDASRGEYAFIECNARLQVEHTVTEEVTDIDLVQLQIALAQGRTLASLGLDATPPCRGYAVQARVNLETLAADGTVRSECGRLSVYEPPSGRGVRVDGYGYAGYDTSPNYDSLLAKVIARGASFAEAAARCERALADFRIDGVPTSIALLRALLADPAVLAARASTRYIEEHGAALIDAASKLAPPRLAAGAAPAAQPSFETLAGATAVIAPLQATLIALEAAEGDLVSAGQTVAVLEAMKMEHVIGAPVSGRIARMAAAVGAIVRRDQPIAFILPAEVEIADSDEEREIDLDHIRPDLAEVLERWRMTRDEARPQAVAKRRARNQRTARENIDDLLDPGSFIEYGAFAIASQRSRHSVEHLLKMSPADGLITGVGTVNAALFGAAQARIAALAYDYTVLAGTQGGINHYKTDRILGIALEHKLPIVWYTEGGGGRPGDDRSGPGHRTFGAIGEVSGEVPMIAIASGYCFAGNASVAGMSDILIATKGSNLGMAGPAMIEGGGMGIVKAADIGPLHEQVANGVVDIVANDEADATRLAKEALSYFQGRTTGWACADQRLLRNAIPENRLRAFDVRALIRTLADTGSMLELRPEFGRPIITALIRIEGRPVGLIANDNHHLGGAIDCDGADKGTRFMLLCDNYGIPVLSLVDTPGFMVGLESERKAAVRKTSRMFLAGAKLGVPFLAVVLRKCYGLGASGMTGGSRMDPMFSVSWPTGEFGPMNLEGAVQLAYRKELAAQPDDTARKALYDKLLGNLYALGKATEHATHLRIDAVIDPADTRRWIIAGLDAAKRKHPSRRWVDAW
ncbi:MAG: carbamoyl-phosphate synthase large subunit [Burkholderiales bacterium]|nr:carbamoyl-phosphate synthase large subunit [Burkholderiales bacterium]